MITKEEAAAAMNGGEYGNEGSDELFSEMKSARLICLFGYSDDVIEVRGADDDAIGAGNTLYFNQEGLLKSECEEGEGCPYFARLVEGAPYVETQDGGDDHGMFRFVTPIPHAVFKIMEDGDLYSSGIVFSLDQLEA